MDEIVRLWPIAALAGAAFLLIAGRLFFWTRTFLRREDPSSTDAGRRRLEAIGASRKRVVLIEGIAVLAAALGLLATFLDLRSGTAGAISADGERMSRALAPSLSGLGVFVLCQGALGLFRSWAETLKTETVLVPPGPIVLPPDILRPSDGTPQPRRPRRPAPPPVPLSARDRFLKVAVLSACLLGSTGMHAAILYVAHRVHTSSAPEREPERAGVFLARIVAPPHEAPPPALEIREEAPPPPPPKPKEPPPPEPPKAETPEPVAPVERPKPEPAPKVEPVTEKTKPEPAPSAPAPVAEAKEPDPEPKSRAAETKEKEKEAEHPKPAAGAPPPPVKFTETAKDLGAPEPAPPAPAPAPAPPAPAKPGSDPAVLGFGDPAKAREKEEPPAGSESRGNADSISTKKDYRQFLAREMKSGAPEGQYVPNLRFGDNKAQENREIMRYFGMELIAYPRNQKFYVYIDPDQGLFSRSSDFAFIRNFSSRAIFRTSPYFDALRAEAARKVDVPADSLVVAQLLKPSSAAYIGWKEAECARRAGVPLDGVEACDATFVKTAFGIWIVRIDRLLLKDGRTLAVDDFEWTKVASNSGGER
jgi:hypothetical protein